MRLTSLILSATVCFSAIAAAQENYSLWPRRPAELEQAQRLIRQQEYDQALSLLAPFLHKRGLTGHESRHLTGAIRTRRYLSNKHPRAFTHTVRRGENIERIATANKTSRDLLILVNAMIDPSDLKVGQKLLILPQDMRAELHIDDREITVWDGQILVATYDIMPTQDLQLPGSNEETQLKERDGELDGARVPRSSGLFTSSDRKLKLANGILITGAENASKSKGVQMKQKELNELSLLLGSGARFSIVRDAKSFDPFPATAPEPTAKKPTANK